MVDLAHYYFHTSLWGSRPLLPSRPVRASQARRQGIATAILHWVARDAEDHDAPRFYWNTTLDNSDGRALYDTVADYSGFIVYNYRRGQGPGPAGRRSARGRWCRSAPSSSGCHCGCCPPGTHVVWSWVRS